MINDTIPIWICHYKPDVFTDADSSRDFHPHSCKIIIMHTYVIRECSQLLFCYECVCIILAFVMCGTIGSSKNFEHNFT